MYLTRIFTSLFTVIVIGACSPDSVSGQGRKPALPQDQWAMLQAAAQIKDAHGRLLAVEEFLRQYPETPFRANVYRLQFMSHREFTEDDDFLWQLGTKYVDAFTRLTDDVSERHEKNPLLANMYSEVAFEFSHRGSHLDGALGYAIQALALMDEAATLQSPKVSEEQWSKGIDTFRAQILNTIGGIQYQRQAYSEAETALSDAVALLPDEGPILYHLGQTYMALKREDEALAILLEAATAAQPAPQALVDLRGLYEKKHGKEGASRLEKDLELAEANAREARALKVTGNRLNIVAKDFTVTGLDGSLVSLSDLRGKVVVLNFWATWCPPCRKEMPVLEDLWNQYDDSEDVMFLVVSVDKDSEKVEPYISENGYTFPVFYGSVTAQLYNIISIPTTLVIDKQGIVQYKHAGYRPEIKDLLTWEVEALR
ncbi:MAG: redoxin domain-containing protein [Candidatus Latescibacteria bacterium]|nr:redoxin domain-containing protein [Candidatus Latescibacterota bacterium]